MELEQGGRSEKAERAFVIFLGKVKLTYEDEIVRASRILNDGGARPPDKFILEAERGEGGPADQEFEPSDEVNLSHPHRKHFRAVPAGGGRA